MNLSKSTMTIEPQTIVADDTATALVTIQFKDAFENNIAVEVTQKIQLDGVVFGKVIEDIHYISAGKYTATIVSTKVGTDQIGFKVGDTFGENGARKSLTYTSGKASITKSVFKVNPDEIIANNVSTSLLTLELRDEFANPITIQTDDDVEFLIKGNAPIGEMSEFTNHQNGTYSAIIKSSKTGVDYFDFTLGGVEAKREDVKVTYIPGIPYAGTSEIKATPNEITTDGIERSTVTVQVKDRLGNNITKSLGPNAVVILTEQAATGKLQAIKDNGDGTYSVVVTSTKTGQDTFIFDIEGVRGVGKDTVTYKPGTASTATSEISVEPALIIADGEDSSTVRVVLKDEFGNRLTTNGDHGSETMSVKLTGLVLAVEKDVTLTYDGGTTGSYSGVVRSVSEGADTIGFTLNGKNATGDKSKAVLTYRSGGVNLRTSKIEISKPKITADRVDSAVVTVTLLDENENVIKDVLHDVELVDVKTGIIEGGFKSIGNGQYQGTIVSEKAGVDTIGFTVDANRATKTVTLEYVAGAPDLSTSWIDVQPKSIIANDRDEAVVTVTLLDKYHNPIIENAAQQNVALDMATLVKGKLSDEAGNGVFTSIGEGKYNLRIKSVKTGVDALNYTLGGDKGKGRPASITYTPGLVNLTVSEIKVNPEEIVADGDAMSRVTIQLKDALGNNTTLKEGGTITLRGVTTGKLRGSMVYVKDGLYEGYISSEKTGKDTIGYDISTIGIGKTEATLTYIAGDVDLKQSTIMAVPNSINADGSQFSTITVHLRDAKGNIVPGNHGVVALTGLNLGDVKSEMTFEDNKYVGEISSIKAGSDTLSFTLDDAPGGTNTTVVYKPGKYVLSESVITATPNEIQADGIETSTVTVQLKDRYGNNTDENAGDVHIEGVEIGNMTSLRLTYQNKGLYSGSIKSKKVGSDTLTFNLNGASFTGTPANVTYNAGELDLSVSTIMANPPRIVADGKELSTVTVQLKDKNGNNLPNGINPKTGQSYKVRLIAPTELTGEMIPVSGEMSDNGNGRFVANIKSTISGDDTFNFEVDGQPGIFTATVHYRAGKVDATNSLISAEPTDIKVSTGEIQSTITVQLRDAEGNLITTGGEQVVINSVDPIGQLSNTKDHGDGRYSATVSSEKVGLEYFGFTVNNVPGSTTTTVRYLPGNVSLDQSTIIAAPKEIVANGVNKSIVSVQLKDGLGNNLDSSAGEVVITGVTLAVQQAPSITATYKGNGLYQLELTSIRAGEDKNISFKLNEVASGKHASIIYHPGALDLAKSVITVSPKSIVADNVDTADITIRLQDSNGNLIGKSAGVVALYFNNGAGAYGKPTDVVDNGDGTYSAKITSTKAHVTDLIGFKVVDQISPSVPAQLTYTHGDYSLEKSELIASPAVIRVSDVDGTVKEASTLTLQLKDAFGNDVHTTAGILTVTITGEGIGQLNGGNNPTVNMIYKADGIYTATVTSTQTGKETFTYKINDEQGESEATVEYKIGALSLLTSQIKVDPAKIEVGGKSTSDTGKYATVSVQILDANGNKPSAEDTVGVVVLTGLKKGDVLEGTKSTEGEVQLTHISEGLFKATIVSEKSGDDVLSFKYGETLEAAAQSGNRAKVTYVAGAISLEESTIKIEPGSITADGQMSATVTVEAKDEFGNTILVESSEPLYLEGVETGILANEQLVYVGAGKYNAIITSTKTGIDKEIGFKVGSTGSKSAKTESLEYTPGDMNLGASTIEINKPSFVVGDAEGAIVTIQFNDANGNKIDGKVVGEIRLNGVVLGNAGDVTFVEKGRYTALITSEKTGMEKIGFSVDGANGANGDTVEVTYTAGDADIAFTEFTVSPVRIVANNETTAKFTVKLRDKFGNLVAASADNTIEIFTKNDPAIGQLSDVAIEKGVYIATVKSQKSGSEHFDFSLNGAKADRNDVSVDYLAGPAHVNTSEITADKQSITADGVASLTLTVSFKDEFGNTIEESRGNIVSIFSTLGSGKIGNLTPIKDNNDGTYSVSVTSTKIGEETFGFTIAGVKARSSVKVEYTPGKAAATTSVISITPDTIQADNVEEGIVSVKLHDIYGNPLNSNGDNAQIFLSGVSTGHYDGLALTHDDTRPGTFTGKITSETVGKDTVGFTLNGVLASGKKSTATIVYKAGGVSATNSIISSSNPKFVADGVESTVITVSLLDKDGHAIDDTTKLHNVILTGVKFGKYNNQVLESIGGGKYTTTITSTKAGTDQIGFTIDKTTASATVQQVYTAGEASLPHSDFSIDKDSITANGTDTAILTLILRDKFNNIVTEDYKGLIKIDSRTLLVGKSAQEAEAEHFDSKGGGVYTFNVKSKQAGEDHLDYMLDGKSGGKPLLLKYIAGSVSPNKTEITVHDSPITADGTAKSRITVQFKDEQGNEIKVNSGSVSLTGLVKGRLDNTGMQYVGNGMYEGYVTSLKAGKDTLGYIVAGVGDGINTAEIEYTAGAVSLTDSLIDIRPGSIIADGSEEAVVTVTLVDANENLITEERGKVTLTGDILGDLKNGMTYDAGAKHYRGTITSTKAGTDTIGFKLDDQSATARASVTYRPGRYSAAHSTIKVTPDRIEADGVAKSTVVVQLHDKYGNKVTTADATSVTIINLKVGSMENVQLSFTGGAGFDYGYYTGEIYSHTIGEDTISFLVDTLPATGKSATIHYVAGTIDLASSVIKIEPNAIVADGEALAYVTVKLKDRTGNIVKDPVDPNTGLRYQVKLVNGQANALVGSIAPANGIMSNDGDGTFFAYVKSIRVGSDQFGFTVDGQMSPASKNGRADVAYTAGAAELRNSIFKATPNTIKTSKDGNPVAESTAILSVQLRDKFGNNIALDTTANAADIKMTPKSGEPIGKLGEVKIVGTQYQVPVYSEKAGNELFTFAYKGVESGLTTRVTYLPGSADMSKSTIVAKPATIQADGIDQSSLIVQLKDSDGNDLTTNAGKVMITGLTTAIQGAGGNDVVASYVGNGRYELTVTSVSAGKDESIGFTLTDEQGTHASSNTTSIEYLAGVVDLAQSTINVTPKAIIADGETQANIMITLRDSKGNPLSGGDLGDVTLHINNGGTVYGTPSAITLKDGIYQATITSNKAHVSDDIGFAVAGVVSSNTSSVSYLAGEMSLVESTITALPAVINANGEETSEIFVQIKDAHGNNVLKNVGIVTITDLIVGKAVNGSGLTYLGNGVYSGKVISQEEGDDWKVGTDTIGFTIAGAKADKTTTVTYEKLEAGEPSLVLSEIAAQPNRIEADGQKRSTITVTLKDVNGDLVSDYSGDIYLEGLNIGKAADQTDMKMKPIGSGKYQIEIVSETIGTDILGFKIGDTTASMRILVFYVAGPEVNLQNSTLTITPTTIVANGEMRAEVVVQLKDHNGHNLTENAGNVVLTGVTTGKVSNEAILTHQPDGTYVGSITSIKAGKDENIDFTLDGVNAGKTASMTYTAGAVNLAKSEISVEPASIMADGATPSTVTIQLKDAFGNDTTAAVAGPVTLTGVVIGDIAKDIVMVSPGKYEAEINAEKPGVDKVGFLVDGARGGTASANGGFATIEYLAAAFDITHSSMTATPEALIANGVEKSLIRITLKDQHDNLINDPNLTIKVMSTKEPLIGKFVGDSGIATYQGQGVYMVKITSEKIGSDELTFSVDETPATGIAKTITYIPGPVSITHSEMSVTPDSILADGVTKATLTITLKDRFGNTIKKDLGENAVKVRTIGTKLGNVSNVTYDAVNSQYVAMITSTVAGTETFSYAILGDESNERAVVTYTEIPKVVGEPSIQTSTITISPKEIFVGGSDKAVVVVTLKDENGMIVKETADKTYTVALTGLSKGELTPSSTDMRLEYNAEKAQYEGIIISNLPADEAPVLETIGFTIDDESASNKATIRYVSDSDSSVSLVTSNIESSDNPLKADGDKSTTITITLMDRSGNAVSDTIAEASEVKLTGVILGDITSNIRREGNVFTATITSTKIGTDQIGFTVNDIQAEKSVEQVYVPGDVDHNRSIIEVIPASIEANGRDAATVYVRLKDAVGHRITDAAVLGDIEVKLVLPSDPLGEAANVTMTAVSGDPGLYSTTVTSEKVGTDTLRFSVEGNESKNSVDVTYTAGPISLGMSTIEVSPKEIMADGTMIAVVKVTLKDTMEHVIKENRPIQLNGLEIGDLASALTYQNDGTYKAEITSKISGSDVLGFTVIGLGEAIDTAEVQYVPATYSLTESTIEASPNSIKADGEMISTITIQLKDENGNNLTTTGAAIGTELSVNLVNLDKGKISTAIAYVGEGRYQAQIVSEATGTDTIGFTLNSQLAKNSTQVTYTAGIVDLTKTKFTVSPTEIVADGIDSAVVTVELRDKFGNPINYIPGQVRLLGVKLGQMANSHFALSLDNNKLGVYSGVITSTRLGTDTIGFSVGGETVTGPEMQDKLSYASGDVDMSTSLINVDPPKILANGIEASTVTVILKDAAGNVINRNIGTVSLTGVDNGQAPKGGKDIPFTTNGVYETTITSTTVGSDMVGFTLEHAGETKEGVDKDTVEYVVGNGDFNQSKSTIEANPAKITADGVMTSTVTVKLYHAGTDNTPLTGYKKLRLKSKDSNTALLGTVKPEYGKEVTAGSGIYEFTVTSTTLGTDNFIFATEHADSTNSATLQYVVGDGQFDDGSSTITVDEPKILADGKEVATVTVKMFYDADGKIPLVGYQGLELVSKDNKLLLGDVVYDTESPDGTYLFKVTSTKLGTDNFAFKTRAKTSKNAVEVEYTTGDGKFDQTASTIVAEPPRIDADGVMTSTITVKLFYASNPTQALIGYKDLKLTGVELGKLKDDAANEVSPGVYEFYVTSLTNGADTFKFTTKAVAESTNSATVTYDAGKGQFSEEHSTIEVDKESMAADGQSVATVTVKLFYAQTKPAEGALTPILVPLAGLNEGQLALVTRDNVSWVAGNGNGATWVEGEQPGVYTFTITSDAVGKDIFTFQTEAARSQKYKTVTYTTGDGEFNADKSTITANPAEILADNTASSTVTVKLIYAGTEDTLITGYKEDLELINEDGSALTGAWTYEGEDPKNAGHYLFTLKSGVLGSGQPVVEEGVRAIDTFTFKTAKQQGTDTATVKYLVGKGEFDPSASTISVDKEEITANGIEKSIVSVKLFYKNAPHIPIIGFDGDDGRLTLVDSQKWIGKPKYIGESEPGTYQFEITSTKLGKDTFKFKVNEQLSANSASVSYVASDGAFDKELSEITAHPDKILADNVAVSTVTVKLFYELSDKTTLLPITGYKGPLSLVNRNGNGNEWIAKTQRYKGEDPANAGHYIFEIQSDAVGSDTFTFKTTDEHVSTKEETVEYWAGNGVFDDANSTIIVDPPTINTDGVDASVVTVKLFYASNSSLAITGYKGTFELVSLDGLDQFDTRWDYKGEKADLPGSYIFHVTSKDKGHNRFTFKTDGGQSTKDATVTYETLGYFNDAASKMTVNKTVITADGMAFAEVKVSLFYQDAVSTPLTGLKDVKLVSLSADGKWTGWFDPQQEIEGVYTFYLFSDELGEDTFTFATANQTSAIDDPDHRKTVKYTAGDGIFDQDKSTIVASPPRIDADGKTTSTITVKLFYESDATKPLAGYKDLKLVTKNPLVGDLLNSGVGIESTDEPGTYTFTVRSGVVGEDEFHFETDSASSMKSATVEYTAGEGKFDKEKSTITAYPLVINTDGVDTSTVTVTLYYENDPSMKIVGYTGEMHLIRKGGLDNFESRWKYIGEDSSEPGSYIFHVTSEDAGENTFSFKTAGAESEKEAKVQYVTEGFFDDKASKITIAKPEIAADGVEYSDVYVELYYANNPTKPITGLDENSIRLISAHENRFPDLIGKQEFISAAGNTTRAESTAPKDAYVFRLRSEFVGDDFVTFETNDQIAKDEPDNQGNIKYSVGTAAFDQGKSSIAVDPAEIDADGEMFSTVTVTLFYASNPEIPINGYAEKLRLVNSNGEEMFIGELDDVQSVERADEAGVYDFIVRSKEVGVDTFHFKTEAYMSDKSKEVKYSAGTGKFDQEKSTLMVDPDRIDADGKSVSTVTIELYYDAGEKLPIIGYEGLGLSLVSSHAGKRSVPEWIGKVGKLVEVGNGVYTFEITSTKVGSDTFTFKTEAYEYDLSKAKTVTYDAGEGIFSEEASKITALPAEITADGVDYSIVEVALFYESNKDQALEGLDSVDLELVKGTTWNGQVTSLGEGDFDYDKKVFTADLTGRYFFKITSDQPETEDTFTFKTEGMTSTDKKNQATVKYNDESELVIKLTPSETNVKVGDVVMFEAEISNNGKSVVSGFNLINSIPGGFGYIKDSAKAQDSSSEMVVNGHSPLDISKLTIEGEGVLKVNFVVRVGAGIKPGTNRFYSEAFSGKGDSISNKASALLTVDDRDPLFDDSLIIGTVYHDRNGNGMQDPGEPGIPGARIASAGGLIITTDQFGRYHLTDISGGKWERGRNFILKIDASSLPDGITFVTPNPLVRRITPGLPTRFDFAIQLPEETILEVSEALFVKGKALIKPAYEQHLSQVLELIKEHEIKEVTILVEKVGTLSEQREAYLQKLLNSKLNDENQIIVGSESQEVEDK